VHVERALHAGRRVLAPAMAVVPLTIGWQTAPWPWLKGVVTTAPPGLGPLAGVVVGAGPTGEPVGAPLPLVRVRVAPLPGLAALVGPEVLLRALVPVQWGGSVLFPGQ
jgi:hypothetical protein